MMSKTTKQLFTAAALAACLAIGAHVAQAEEHHSHHGAEPAKLTLNNGKKWATEDNLHHGMTSIRNALAADLPAIHGGKESAQQYRDLAKKVDDQVEFMVKSCKLDKDADAMLHLVLARIIAGSHDMAKQKGDKGRRQGAEKIVHALEDYATYFDHPGWQGFK